MECKYCGAQLGEGATLCSACGKELNAAEPVVEETTALADEIAEAVEETPATIEEEPAPVEKNEEGNKHSGLKLFLIGFAGALAAITLVIAVLYASGVLFKNDSTEPVVTDPTEAPTAGAVDPTEEATEPTIALEASGLNDILNKLSYTVADDQADQWKDQVVATVGDMQLTNAELQLYYWSYVIDFLNNYSYYLSYFGLDYTQPLDQQLSMEGNMTWQHFFLEGALLTWHKYAVLEQYGDADGFQMAEESKEFLESLPTHLESALEGTGYDTVEALLKADMGALCTVDSYYNYMNTYYKALEYFDAVYESLTPTEDEIVKFFNDNEESFASSGITMDSGYYYDVRHILIKPQGGTTDENGNVTYTDAEWEACRVEAQAILDQWLAANGTEEDFAELAIQYSTDSGSAANGGLYSNLTKDTNFVTEFKDWYMDENRMTGDTGLVKSYHGYHIMYFITSRNIWYFESASAAQQDKANRAVSAMMEGIPMVVDYANIALGEVKLG